MHEVEAYIAELEDNQWQIMWRLHSILNSIPDITPKIAYKIPFYYRKKWLCYLNPVKNSCVELVFLKGNELSNVQGLLESRERKMVAGITFVRPEDIPVDLILEIIHEYILLEDQNTA